MIRLLEKEKVSPLLCCLYLNCVHSRAAQESKGLNNRPVVAKSSSLLPSRWGARSVIQKFSVFQVMRKRLRGWLAMNSLSTLQLVIYIYGWKGLCSLANIVCSKLYKITNKIPWLISALVADTKVKKEWRNHSSESFIFSGPGQQHPAVGCWENKCFSTQIFLHGTRT